MNRSLKKTLLHALIVIGWFLGLVIVMGLLSLPARELSSSTKMTVAAAYTLGFYFLTRWGAKRYIGKAF